MPHKRHALLIIPMLLTACYKPPYNNFEPDHRMLRHTATGAAIGTIAGAAAGGTLIGTAAGGVTGTVVGLYKDSKPSLIVELQEHDIQFVEYGDTLTLLVPTDKYFIPNSPRLNDLCWPGLASMIKLLRLYPDSPIQVAGFTDNIGTREHKKKLSQAQAETMLTFLWANGVESSRLRAQGYGDDHAISNNDIIHGSAQNRRIEIQWTRHPDVRIKPPLAVAYSK